MTTEETIKEIIKSCQKYGINADLVCCMASIESSSKIDHLAVACEPNYRWVFNVDKFAKKLGTTYYTENCLQSMSYGPLQIMGATLREMFFQESLMKMVYDPLLVIDYSCKRIKMLFDKYGNEEDVLACWNGGNRKKYIINGLLQYSNQSYVDKVMGVYNSIKSSKINLEGDK